MAGTFFRSKGFRITAAVFGVLLIILLALPFLVSVDQFRPEIVSLIEGQTGRKIEIEKLRLGLLPSIRVEVHGFRVKNPKGFPEGDTLAVGRIDVGAELMPLFDKQLKVTSITVRGVEVNLLENQHGAVNYDPARGMKKAQKAAAAAEASPAFTMEAIDTITVRDIRLTSGSYHTGRKTVREGLTLTGLNAELRNLRLQDSDWLEEAEIVVPLSGITASTSALTAPLRFEAGEFTIRKGAGEGHFKAALDTIRAEGTIKIPSLAKPRAEFAVTVPELDLSRLIALTAGSSAANSGGGSAPARPPATRRLLATGTIKMDRVLLPPLRAENLSGQIRLYTHRLEVQPFSLSFYNGTIKGDVNLNRASSRQPLTFNAAVEGVDIGRMMKDVAPDSKRTITGTFEARAMLRSNLADNPMASLTGEGTLAVRDGTLPGIDLRGTVMKMAKLFNLGLPESSDTEFTYFGGDFRVAGERVHSREIRLDSEAVKARIKGSAGFDTTLNYKGTAVLTGDPPEEQQQKEEKKSRNPFAKIGEAIGGAVRKTLGTIGMFRVPLSLKGNLEDPKLTLAGKPQRIKEK